jgi:hypothetical protein
MSASWPPEEVEQQISTKALPDSATGAMRAKPATTEPISAAEAAQERSRNRAKAA